MRRWVSVALLAVALAPACGDEQRAGPPAGSGNGPGSGGTAASGFGGFAGQRVAGAGGLDDAGADASDASGGDAATDAPADVQPDAPPYVGPTFTDVTQQAGVDYLQWDGVVPQGCPDMLCEVVHTTGGAAASDFDDDGWVDLFVTRINASPILFRNRGDGTFEDVSTAAGVNSPQKTNGAAFGDIDNDGDPDLLVTTLLEDRYYLFVNDGDGTFSEDAEARGVALSAMMQRYGTHVAFGDYDRDGWSDAYVAEWRIDPVASGQVSLNRLLRNRGASEPGVFEDVTQPAGVVVDDPQDLGVFGFAPTFSDLDDDGWPDLALANDFGTSRLFWNTGTGTFIEDSASAIGTDENGMGSTIGDYDGDGRLDWFVTSIHDPDDACDKAGCNWGKTGNRLYRNLGGRRFEDATDAAGVRAGGWGWGASFFDYDNDGDLDLVMTNGIDFPDITFEDAFNAQPMRLWRNDGGVMTEVAAPAGIDDADSGKGLLVFDYDRDGDLDVFVVNNAGHPKLYRNDGGNQAAWLQLRLTGTSANRDAFGARVIVRASAGGPEQVRELRGGNNFGGQNQRILHFGLGNHTGPVAEVRIRWPGAASEQVLTDVGPGRVAVTQP